MHFSLQLGFIVRIAYFLVSLGLKLCRDIAFLLVPYCMDRRILGFLIGAIHGSVFLMYHSWLKKKDYFVFFRSFLKECNSCEEV
jgi:hypothetical protein